MYRVGIIGCENSHAAAFIDVFSQNAEYSDIKVVYAWSAYPEACDKLKSKYGDVEIITPDEMLDKVDAVMITARDGKYHCGFARPFVEKGIPVFMDKPFAVDGNEAVELVKLAKKRGTPIVGGSSLKSCYDVLMLKNEAAKDRGAIKSGTVIAPLSMNNDYSGFYFYSSHLAETLLAIFGYDPKEVTAKRCGDSVNAIVSYDNFSVGAQFTEGCYRYFGQVVWGTTMYSREIDISLCYKHECEEFADMLRNGKMKYTYEQLVKPVYLLNAIYKSYTENKTVAIKEVVL